MKTTSQNPNRSFLCIAAAFLAVQLITVPLSRALTGCGENPNVVCLNQHDPPPCGDCDCPPGSGNGGAGGASPGSDTPQQGSPNPPSGAVPQGVPSCPSCGQGSPVWWVSDEFVNARLEDQPVWYNPARGPRISFHLSYRQRGAIAEEPNIFGIGTNWSCSFRAFLADLSSFMRLHRGGAGWIDYTNGVPQFRDGSILSSPDGGVTWQIERRDGSKDVFGQTFASGGITYHLLTAQTDPAGSTVTYTYSNSPTLAQLLTVSDPDGRVSTLSYTNLNFPLQITSVTDPFGRTCQLQ